MNGLVANIYQLVPFKNADKSAKQGWTDHIFGDFNVAAKTTGTITLNNHIPLNLCLSAGKQGEIVKVTVILRNDKTKKETYQNILFNEIDIKKSITLSWGDGKLPNRLIVQKHAIVQIDDAISDICWKE